MTWLGYKYIWKDNSYYINDDTFEIRKLEGKGLK